MKWIHKCCLLESIELLESDICTVCKYQYKTTEFKNSKLYLLLSKYKENKYNTKLWSNCIKHYYI